jgi:hypothetical protein
MPAASTHAKATNSAGTVGVGNGSRWNGSTSITSTSGIQDAAALVTETLPNGPEEQGRSQPVIWRAEAAAEALRSGREGS